MIATLGFPGTSPGQTSEPGVAAEEPEQACPNSSYPDATPFGASIEEIRSTFASCTIREGSTPSSLVRFAAIQEWYLEGLTSMLGFPLLPESLAPSLEVDCDCWSSIQKIVFVFHQPTDMPARLMMVEKDLDLRGGSRTVFDNLVAATNPKAGFSGRETATQYSPDYQYWYPAVIGRWNGKTQDLMIAVAEGELSSLGVNTVRSLLVGKVEYRAYLDHLRAARDQQERATEDEARQAADEL